MTTEEAIRAMLDGARISAINDETKGFFLTFDGTGFIDSDGHYFYFDEGATTEWELYEEPKEHGDVQITIRFHVSASKA